MAGADTHTPVFEMYHNPNQVKWKLAQNGPQASTKWKLDDPPPILRFNQVSSTSKSDGWTIIAKIYNDDICFSGTLDLKVCKPISNTISCILSTSIFARYFKVGNILVGLYLQMSQIKEKRYYSLMFILLAFSTVVFLSVTRYRKNQRKFSAY